MPHFTVWELWFLWVGIQILIQGLAKERGGKDKKSWRRVQVWSRHPGAVRYKSNISIYLTLWAMFNVQRSTPTPKWLAAGMGGRGFQPTSRGCPVVSRSAWGLESRLWASCGSHLSLCLHHLYIYPDPLLFFFFLAYSATRSWCFDNDHNVSFDIEWYKSQLQRGNRESERRGLHLAGMKRDSWRFAKSNCQEENQQHATRAQWLRTWKYQDLQKPFLSG